MKIIGVLGIIAGFCVMYAALIGGTAAYSLSGANALTAMGLGIVVVGTGLLMAGLRGSK